MDQASALERLEALIGRWRTTGSTIDASGGEGDQIEAVDTYERLPGGALLHLVDARVGEQKVEGAEIIGFDPERERYATQYFGTDGPAAYEATLSEEDGATVWAMQSEADRFKGTFSADGDTITGHWEAVDDGGNWRPWMNITLTRRLMN
jgi:Protein of unknown function (DUF1579)